MIEILGASLIVMFASLAGVFAVWKRAGRFIENNLDFLISFSAGVFAIIAYTLATETLAHAEEFTTGLAWILGSAFAAWILFKFLPALHAHPDEDKTVPKSSVDIRRMILSDGVHNIGDGILLAASFAAAPIVGIITTLSVFIHELIQEVSEFFVLRGAGYSSRQALKLNFIISGAILIGSVGGFFLLETFEALEVPLLGIAAGMVMVVVLHDLIPHSLQAGRSSRHLWLHLIWFMIGLVLMFGITSMVGHAHEEEHDHDHSFNQTHTIS